MPALSGPTRAVMVVAAGLVLTVSSGAPAAVAAPAQADVPASERAAATVNPALVRVTGTFVGWVHDGQGTYANGGRPYTVTFTCSGFGVHPDGYLATVGHCVDANDLSVRETFITAAAEEAVENRPDVPLGDMIEYGRSAWSIEGQVDGSPIDSEIRVSGIPGAPLDGVFARVVDDRPIGQGDVALLKVDTTNMPTLELATGAALAVDAPLLSVGYPDSAGDVIAPEAQPSVVDGVVVATTTDGGRPIYDVNAALEAGMSGGPAVDQSGRVVGINSVRTNGAQTLNFVVPISGLTDLLGRNGVTAEMGPRDRLYREAIDDYYAGEHTDAIEAVDRLQQEAPVHPRVAKLRADADAARQQHGDASENRMQQTLIWVGVAVGVVVLVVVAVLLVLRRRRRTPVVTMGAPHPPFPGPGAGAPWPGAPFPAPQQPRPSGGPNNPYAPPTQAPPVARWAPNATPGRPGAAPQPFGDPTRPVGMRPPAPPTEPHRGGGSDRVTTRIILPGSGSAPRSPVGGADREDAGPTRVVRPALGSDGETTRVVLPRSGSAATSPATSDPEHGDGSDGETTSVVLPRSGSAAESPAADGADPGDPADADREETQQTTGAAPPTEAAPESQPPAAGADRTEEKDA